VHYGPQPFEAFIAEVCEAFGCLPSEAMGEDLELVQRIILYRNAKQALALAKQGKSGMAILQKHPGLIDILLRLTKAQTGSDMTVEQMFDLIETDEEESADRD